MFEFANMMFFLTTLNDHFNSKFYKHLCPLKIMNFQIIKVFFITFNLFALYVKHKCQKSKKIQLFFNFQSIVFHLNLVCYVFHKEFSYVYVNIYFIFYLLLFTYEVRDLGGIQIIIIFEIYYFQFCGSMHNNLTNF